MRYGFLSSSAQLSAITTIPSFSEQSLEQCCICGKGGVLIGSSEKSEMPFFLSPEVAVNPHVFIAGMSGSGKTYMTRSLMAKLVSVLGHRVILIDFTGEYREFAGHVASGLLEYADLSGMPEKRKIRKGQSIVAKVTARMRERSADKDGRLFLVLDEAWKLLLKDRSLETVVREGRKYGVGLVLASQRVEDIEATMLANIATLFVFRTQSNPSLKRLALDCELSEAQVSRVQNLEVGSCMAIQSQKGGTRRVTLIKRVLGIELPRPIQFRAGDKVVEVEYKKIEVAITRITGKESAAELLARINIERSIALHAMMQELMRLGARRRMILAEMRALGISDADIAEAFAIAMKRSATHDA